MQLDILIFAVITFFLVLKLKSVLGTRNGNEPGFNGHQFVLNDKQKEALKKVIELAPKMTVETPVKPEFVSNQSLLKGTAGEIEKTEEGLKEIFEADKSFNLQDFIAGANYAFEIIVTSFSKGDLNELKPLLSSKLFEGFEKAIKGRAEKGIIEETKLDKLLSSKITEAHLGGTMAYITVEYEVEKTVTVKGINGEEISSNTSINNTDGTRDIWTFTRDIRSNDPNWILISTRVF